MKKLNLETVRTIGYVSAIVGGITTLISLWAENKLLDSAVEDGVNRYMEEKGKETK